MKILTKEQEAAHYRAVLYGGFVGGFSGLAVGTVGVLLAQRRYHFFRNLTIPLKAFLITSSGTFAGIINADHYSRAYESQSNPKDREFHEREKQRSEADKAGKTFTERAMDFGRKERYKIVGASWIASMVAAFAIVNRNKYLSGAQKIVQARVYAQFLTVGVLVATAAFEISDSKNAKGRYETVRYLDPNDPEHKRYLEKQVEKEAGSQGNHNENDDLWKDMVAAEEQRIKEREERHKEWEKDQHQKKSNGNGGNKKKAAKKESDGEDTQEDKKDDKKEEKK